MKIKISKSQWEGMGKKAGWMKEAGEMSYEEELARFHGDLIDNGDPTPDTDKKIDDPIIKSNYIKTISDMLGEKTIEQLRVISDLLIQK